MQEVGRTLQKNTLWHITNAQFIKKEEEKNIWSVSYEQ
jgi:hypothetical protein